MVRLRAVLEEAPTFGDKQRRDASAQFREQLYQKALELRQRQDEPDFSPSPQFPIKNNVAQQGQANDKLSDDQRQS